MIAYEVKQIRVSSSRVVLQNSTDTLTVLSGFSSCSEYSVEVRAYTSAGPGVYGSLPSHILTSGMLGCLIGLLNSFRILPHLLKE